MKRIYSLLLCFCMVMLAACAPPTAPSPAPSAIATVAPTANNVITPMPSPTTMQAVTASPLLLKNGEFNSDDSWSVYLEGGVADWSITAEKEGLLSIKNAGSVQWGVQLYQDGIELIQGNEYRLSFDARSTLPRAAVILIQKNGAPYNAYTPVDNIDLTDQMQRFTIDFKMNEPTDIMARLALNAGPPEGTPSPGAHDIYLDNFALELISGEQTASAGQQEENNMQIHINQVGYLPGSKKIAVFSQEIADNSFRIVDDTTNQQIFTGTLGQPIFDAANQHWVTQGDFTALDQPGRYRIEAQGATPSYPFEIGNDVYQQMTDAVLDFFYLQRCGQAIPSGDWAHEACHTQLATVYGTSQQVEVAGGWHDAGDYGRYVSPAAKAVADLLLTVENGTNKNEKLLDEVKYELEWMLKMQDAQTGGVYHKVTPQNFCGFIMPEEELEPLYLSPISPTATAGFAASMAQAARVYQQADPSFAQRCLTAARSAWQWCQQNPNAPGFINPQGIVTGEYGDANSTDERYWAAAELYKTTLEQPFEAYLKTVDPQKGMGWENIGYYGTYAYLTIPQEKTDPALRTKIEKSLKEACAHIIGEMENDGYNLSLGMDYPWGSNMTVANNAMLLIWGTELLQQDYRDAALEHLHYLLGRNGLSQSYITGYGSKTAHNPHHRPTVATGKVMPGMVIGGPDNGLHDPVAQKLLQGKPAAQSYIDHTESYSTNEMTIYWNSPVYFLLCEAQR